MKNKLTRKNKLAVCLATFFSLISLFVALCLDANYTVVADDNPIALLGEMLNYEALKADAGTWVMVILFFAYVIVYTYCVCKLANYFKENQIKTYSAKAFLWYGLALLICAALSIGIGSLFQIPYRSVSHYVDVLRYLYQSLLLGIILFAILVLFFGAIIGTIFFFTSTSKAEEEGAKEEQEAEDEEEDDEKGEEADLDNTFEPLPDENENNQAVAAIASGAVAGGSAAIGTGTALTSLGDKKEVFKSLTSIDENQNLADYFPNDDNNITLAELVRQLQVYLANSCHLYYNLRELALFIAAFAATHLVILEGISGTGKSSLPRYFAQFIGEEVFFESIQVTYKDKTDLLGYYNEFTGKYMETNFLKRLYSATYKDNNLNIMVLDEMNISRVEYYFADFLSVLEFPVDQRKITLLQLPESYDAPEHLKEGVLQLTPNTYFIGTCNQDDSTFTLTDKVIDRAIVIDFDNYQSELHFDEDVKPLLLSYNTLENLFEQASQVEANKFNDEDKKKLFDLLAFMNEEFGITIGNRILNQLIRMTPIYIALGRDKDELVDHLFSSKVLRKLNGRFDTSLRSSLKKLDKKLDELYGAESFISSRKAIDRLTRRLG